MGLAAALRGFGGATTLVAMAGTEGAMGARVPLPVLGETPSAPRPTIPECYGDVCITCSDTAVQVTVLRLLGDGLAVVDTGQGEEEVSVALVEAQPGDTILVHAKEAIAIVGR